MHRCASYQLVRLVLPWLEPTKLETRKLSGCRGRGRGGVVVVSWWLRLSRRRRGQRWFTVSLVGRVNQACSSGLRVPTNTHKTRNGMKLTLYRTSLETRPDKTRHRHRHRHRHIVCSRIRAAGINTSPSLQGLLPHGIQSPISFTETAMATV